MFEEKIAGLSEKYYEQMKELRHYFHMYPELAFNEVNTSKVIEEQLKKLNITNITRLAKTGVSAVIKGKYPGKTILIRADMDAVPVNEESDVEYKSKNSGVMHGCGHDGHTAALLGVAMILNELQDNLYGNVKIIFQPAEEGEGGANLMIKEGVLENPKVDAAIACHLQGDVKEGCVAIKKGTLMASCDDITLKIIGKSGHGSTPELCVNPIDISANFMVNIKSFLNSRISAFEPVVFSFGGINGGNSCNCIPDEVTMMGSLRTFDNGNRKFILESMENILKLITEAHGATYEMKVNHFAPPVINEENITDISMNSISKIIGKDNVINIERPYTGSEDFAFFSNEVSSTYFFVGIMKDEEVIHHNSKFAWDDMNLLTACRCLSQIAVDFLNEGK